MTENDRKRLSAQILKMEVSLTRLYGAAYTQCLGLNQVREAVENADSEFEWDNYPAAKKQMEQIINKLSVQTATLISKCSNASAAEAGVSVNKTIKAALGGSKENDIEIDKIHQTTLAEHRTAAKEAKAARGLDISKRVWRYKMGAPKELEGIIQQGVLQGKSADEVARSAHKYLVHPDMLFRRVRNVITGELELSKMAKEYHPGPGVYRSAYKNAMRLARTEVNMAYRESEWQKYQDDPLIKYYEVQISNHHTTKLPNGGEAVGYHDICDELAGRYPKEFKFVGWHPQCRCRMVPVTLTPEEFGKYIKAKKEGNLEEWKESQSKVDLPRKFTKWVDDNKDRIDDANASGKSIPYFIKDNYKDGDVNKGLSIDSIRKFGKAQEVFTATINSGNIPKTRILDKNNISEDELKKNRVSLIEELFWNDISKYPFWYKSISPKSPKDFNELWDSYSKRYESIYEIQAMDHLAELGKYDGSQIAPSLRNAYYNVLQKINSYNPQVDGFYNMYFDIEEAYNIHMLSTMKNVQKFGYDRVSKNTPYQLFEKYKSQDSMNDGIPSKEFFDSLPQFVPLRKPSGSSAYYGPITKCVYITIGGVRMKNNPWYSKNVFYHEYGHAKDKLWKSGTWRDDKLWKDLHSKYSKKYATASQIDDAKNIIQKKRDQLGMSITPEQDEMIGAIEDTMQSLCSTHEYMGKYGHPKQYFQSKAKQLAEFIAHASENKYGSNPIFKELFPDLYEDMIKLIESY